MKQNLPTVYRYAVMLTGFITFVLVLIAIWYLWDGETAAKTVASIALFALAFSSTLMVDHFFQNNKRK